MKPLGLGFFHTKSGPRAVFATVVTADELGELDFADAPFVAQERMEARQHLRVVTVGERAWTGVLAAGSRPLDWRSQEEAHAAWLPMSHTTVERAAVELAQSFGLGFSSQDWVCDSKDEPVFLDLNPGGQWLFLPDTVAAPATIAIAGFLAGHRS